MSLDTYVFRKVSMPISRQPSCRVLMGFKRAQRSPGVAFQLHRAVDGGAAAAPSGSTGAEGHPARLQELHRQLGLFPHSDLESTSIEDGSAGFESHHAPLLPKHLAD